MVEKFQEEIIDIEGMDCNDCVALIESTLSKMHGIEKTRLSLVEKKAFVRFDSSKTSTGEIRNVIEGIKGMNYKTEISSDEDQDDLDDPDDEDEKEIQEEVINLKGMHCKSCVETIEEEIGSLKGIESVKASLAEDKVFVKFDPEVISTDKIKSRIKALGYSTDGSHSEGGHSNDSEAKSKVTLKQGIIYGLIPHIGCIAFIIGSVLGVTVLTQLFRPILMNPYFFQILLGMSIGFATISSAFYLRKNGLLSVLGAKKKWKYLSTMYGSTVGINVLLFLVIFPLLANVSFAAPTGNFLALSNGVYSVLTLQVDIPCSGHAPLISDDIKALNGILAVKFSLPNTFEVSYDPSAITKQQILALDVFKTYKATVLSESSDQSSQLNVAGASNTPASTSVSVGNDGNLATVTDGVQVVQLSVQGSTYYPNPIRVKKGIPVQLVADINNMPGCSKSIVIPEFGVSKYVSAGDNIIQFTPTKAGTFQFSCSMNMYRGQIIVEESDGSVPAYTGSAPAPSGGSCGGSGGGCGCGG
ncbi:MAG: copper ion binding protein [Candidatus Aenigmatarchaeota archaeon]